MEWTVPKEFFVGHEHNPKWFWYCSDFLSAFAKRDHWNRYLVRLGKVGDLVVYRFIDDGVHICEGEYLPDAPYGPVVKDYNEKEVL